MVDSRASTFFEEAAEQLADRMGKGIFASWKATLAWAQVNDNFTTWTPGGMHSARIGDRRCDRPCYHDLEIAGFRLAFGSDGIVYAIHDG